VHKMVEAQSARQWDRSIANHIVMPEGKNVLVLGYGSIGQEMAKMVAPLGMKVIGTNRNGAPQLGVEIHKADALHRLLPLADVLVVAAPSRPETDSIIGAKELALMKKTAVLVNISRGKLVDTMALDAALRSGQIAGAGLDVTEPEPLPSDHPLWTAPNLIVSPHVAGAAGAWAADRQASRVASNLRLYLAGKPVENVVRP
jgi:phosphoglycerate dehydrogenase-like enzyme